MRVEWFVAKYMPDLRRREPKNVGVILYSGDTVTFRFMGQRPDGQIDGRRIKWAGSVRTYKAWVDYWKRTAPFAKERRSELLSRVSDANYFVEPGGTRLLGSKDLDPATFLDSLFSALVSDVTERATLTVQELSDAILARMGIAEDVKRDVAYNVPRASGSEDSLYFDYEYENGAVSLMQRVALFFEGERSWDAAHAAAWSFERAKAAPLSQGRTQHLIALVKSRGADKELRNQLGLLREVSDVVDVTDEDRASAELGEILNITKPSLGGP